MQTTDTQYTYEELTDRAREARSTLDEHRYELGDIALLVEKQYGRNLLGDFAKDIGLVASTVRRYRAVSSFYTNDIRVSLSPLVTWSHADLARRYAVKVADTPGQQVEAALALLEAATDNGWTVDKLQVEVKTMLGKTPTPQKITDLTGVLSLNIGGISLSCHDYNTDLLKPYEGKTVRIVIYEED